MTRSRWDAVLS